jgi:integrase
MEADADPAPRRPGLRRRPPQAGPVASIIANALDPLRVIFRRAIRRDEVSIDPTDNLDLPAIRSRRDRIEPPERAHEYLAALPDSERTFWAVALFCGLRRGELRGLQWTNVDFEGGVIRVERSWDPVKDPVDVKTGAGRRAVPMAFVVRRELMAHKARTGRDGPDLVFGRTATEAFFASTIRARANKAWKAAGLDPITPHEARHCAISYFIAAGLDWKQISTWAGHGDVRQTWNRYGHLMPAGEDIARERLDAFLTPTQPNPTVAHHPNNDETPEKPGGSCSTATGIRSQPLRSEVGRFYLQICWFLARREPLLRGSKPPSIGVDCGATVAQQARLEAVHPTSAAKRLSE